jgi:23S rRNA (pseudouridine1915-N3)-methyltransferase
MTIRVISIGKTNVDFIKSGLDQYLDRLKHYAKVSWEELPDVRKIDRNQPELLKQKEGEALLSAMKPGDTVLLLDEGGKAYSSVQLAELIEQAQLYPSGDLVFLIGGAFGFSSAVYDRANRKVSLSAMTFTHQMVRLILAEQLYRSFTIIRGEPYHHV